MAASGDTENGKITIIKGQWGFNKLDLSFPRLKYVLHSQFFLFTLYPQCANTLKSKRVGRLKRFMKVKITTSLVTIIIKIYTGQSDTKAAQCAHNFIKYLKRS